MEIAQLRYFLAVCRTSNFSKAAEELYITQPTLSQQLKRLENELGIPLFERSTRKVQLTEAGEACREYAQNILDNVDRLTATASEYLRNQTGSLKIGILTLLPQLNVTSAIAAFQKDYPNIAADMEFGWSGELLDRLCKKQLDAVVSNVVYPLEEQYQELDIHVFSEDYLCVVLSRKHPLATRKKIPLSALQDEIFWMDGPSTSIGVRLRMLAEELDLPPLKMQEIHSIPSVFKMVEANMGVSVISKNVGQEYLRPGMCSIPLEPRTKSQIALVMRKERKKNNPTNLFAEFFLKYIEAK